MTGRNSLNININLGSFEMQPWLYCEKQRANNNDSPTPTDESFIRSLKDYILNQPEEQHFYDFKIVCSDNIEIPCHKIILASQTKYFEGLFRQQNSDSVRMDFQCHEVRTCIKYLYTEDIKITGDNVQDILVVANYLNIPKVVRTCVRYIRVNMDISNCIDILTLGDQLNIQDISKNVIDSISYSIDDVFKDEGNLKRTPLHLMKAILSNENVTLRHSKVTLPDSEKKTRLAAIAWKYCTLTSQTGEMEELLALINTLPERRELDTIRFETFGSPADQPRGINTFNLRRKGKHFIQKVTLKTNIWDSRAVVSGLALKWTDGTEDAVGGGEVAAQYVVPDGEHISLVHGHAGWYVDTLTFVLSNGKLLGDKT